jgi:hypothetical protein
MFYLPFFFIKLFFLVPKDMPRNDFNFFRIFEELFDYFGDSPVSTAPVKLALPVSLTPARNSSPVSMTLNDAFTVLYWPEMIYIFAVVVDTGKASFAGINDNGNACIAGVIYTGDAPTKF